MEIGVANAAEQDFELDVVRRGLTSGDGGVCQRRGGAGGGIRFNFGCIHAVTILQPQNLSLAERANLVARHAKSENPFHILKWLAKLLK